MPSAKPFAEYTYREADAARREVLLTPFADGGGSAVGGLPIAVPLGVTPEPSAAVLGGGAEAAWRETAAFLAGNHWQNGRGWVGPGALPDGSLAPDYATRIHRQFTPIDAVGEVADNVGAGLTGTEPGLDLAPLVTPAPSDAGGDQTVSQAAERQRADALDILSGWWDRVRLAMHAAQVARRLPGYARAPLRLFPRADAYVTTEENGRQVTRLRTVATFREAINLLDVEAPDPEWAALVQHPTTREWAAVVRADRAENGVTVRAIHLWTVDAATGQTLVRELIENDADRDAARPAPPIGVVNLGGRLPVTEARTPLGRPLITDAVRRQQRRLNYFESANVRGVETAGFRERSILNAEPFGQWLPYSPGYPTETELRDGEGGEKVLHYFHREAPTLGAAIVSEISGRQILDDQGRVTGYTDPEVVYENPVDPAIIGAAADRGRFTILRECRQPHLATGSTAQLSGDAYEQARAVWDKYLKACKGPGVETPLREILEAAVAWARALNTPVGATEPADPLARAFDQWRIVVTAVVDPGPVRADTRRQLDEAVRNGTRAHASALAEQGVEDVRAELGLLEADPVRRLARLEAQSKALAALRDLSSLEAGLRYMVERGLMTPDEAAAFAPQDTDGLDPAASAAEDAAAEAAAAAAAVRAAATRAAADLAAVRADFAAQMTAGLAAARAEFQAALAAATADAAAARAAAESAAEAAAARATPPGPRAVTVTLVRADAPPPTPPEA